MPYRLVATVFLIMSSAAVAVAHKPSDSYLRIDSDSASFSAEWDIALRDLELLVGLDDDQDSRITWGELRRKEQAVAAHALSRLIVRCGDEAIPLEVSGMKVTSHSDGAYAVLSLEGDRPSSIEPLEIEYDLLFDVDPTHRGLVLLRSESSENTYILSPEQPSVTLDSAPISPLQTLAEYVREGVWHIWIGFDHILFLITLLLPAVLVRESGAWRGAESLRSACLRVLHIVTMFTLAHSITLWLAVTDYVSLPSQWVEASIALSIIASAAANLFPKLPISGWKIAFLFGLIHGFGFANVLVDLGLSSGSLAVALFGFNVGVELGQVAIVLAFLPIAYAIRRTGFYRVVVLGGGSVAIATVAAIWAYERICNVEVLGF